MMDNAARLVITLIYKVGNEFSWFGWPDWPRNVSAQFFGRSGKDLYGAFSIVGMASQSHNVNKGIPDDRVARSNYAGDGYRRSRVTLGISLTMPNKKYFFDFLLLKIFIGHNVENFSYKSPHQLHLVTSRAHS